MGFDAVELFMPHAQTVDAKQLRSVLDDTQLALAAVGTGAGWVRHKLSLTAADSGQRRAATQYVRSLIEFAAPFSASAIIGSMQGCWSEGVDRATATGYLREGLAQLGEVASSHGVPLIYEPLNRYESNLCNTVAQGVELLDGIENVVLLADLFHMNIEEANLADALRSGADRIGHVHFVDSNRQPVGAGHTLIKPIAQALRDIGYDGYLSAEALPLPDPKTAAQMTIDSFRQHFGDNQ